MTNKLWSALTEDLGSRRRGGVYLESQNSEDEAGFKFDFHLGCKSR